MVISFRNFRVPEVWVDENKGCLRYIIDEKGISDG